jgi:L-gulono-1,4-lactone dehydrogenase
VLDVREREELRAARVSLGALGAMSAVTLRCVPAFTIHRLDEPRPLGEVLPRLDELVGAHDHWEAFILAYTRTTLTLSSDRTDREPRPPGPARAFVRDLLIQNAALGAACRVGRRFPSLIPFVNRRLAALIGRAERLDASRRVYANTRLVRFTEMEYGIPREHAAEALERVLALIERRRLRWAFRSSCGWLRPTMRCSRPPTGAPLRTSRSTSTTAWSSRATSAPWRR